MSTSRLVTCVWFPGQQAEEAALHSVTDATSFQVICEDQREMDHFWDRLTEGGQESRCGWLTDRFGVSWQMVPRLLMELMSGADRQAAGRVQEQMLSMVKLDLAPLGAAARG